MVGLKMSSLTTLELKSSVSISFVIWGTYGIYFPILHRSCLLRNQFYPLLRYEHSEK
jgi:hypothetical protein